MFYFYIVFLMEVIETHRATHWFRLAASAIVSGGGPINWRSASPDETLAWFYLLTFTFIDEVFWIRRHCLGCFQIPMVMITIMCAADAHHFVTFDHRFHHCALTSVTVRYSNKKKSDARTGFTCGNLLRMLYNPI